MKKALTILLAFVMVFTVQAGMVSAASFADTAGVPCETAVDVLSALDIVEGIYEPVNSLTRAEIAAILHRFIEANK